MIYDQPLNIRDVHAIRLVLELYKQLPGTFNSVSIIALSPYPQQYEVHQFWPPEMVIVEAQPPEKTVYWSMEYRYPQSNGQTHLNIPISPESWT